MFRSKVPAYAASAAGSLLAASDIVRRAPGAGDVEIEILYCGICSSDLQQVHDVSWNTSYPCVPGHQIIGRVTGVGIAVTKFRLGDLIAVGSLVDSCGTCENCREGYPSFCLSSPIQTSNGRDRHLGGHTFGGYSTAMVVNEAFVLSVPVALDPAATAPLLCNGIAAYSPLRHWEAGPGQSVGVAGLGGIGSMGVRFAKAMGARVVAFTKSHGKVEEGLRLGADEVVLSSDAGAMARHRGSFDVILDTVPAPHASHASPAMLKPGGTLARAGASGEYPSHSCARRRTPALTRLATPDLDPESPPFHAGGSAIGGVGEIQEMLDFCAVHRIVPDVEEIPMHQVNEAWERLRHRTARHPFVINLASLKS